MRRSAAFFFVILSWVVSGCSAYEIAILDNTPLKNIEEQNKRMKAVVLPFQMEGAPWGDEFSDSVSLQLMKTGKFEIVERSALKKILSELQITESGLFDAGNGVRIGKLLKADFILLGKGKARSVETFQKTFTNLVDTFSLKIIHVETASNYVIIRKKHGIAWDWPYRAMWCLGLTLIWERQDILVDSTQYDQVAADLVSQLKGSVFKKLPNLPAQLQ